VRHLNAAFARIWTINSTGEVLTLQASGGIYTNLDGRHSRIEVGQLLVGSIARDRSSYCTNDLQNDPRLGDPDWARRERMVAFAGYPLQVDERLVGVLAIYSRHVISENILSALEAVAGTIAVGIERKRLEEQLRQGQKMEAIGQLAGGVAHDFNNLLTLIFGYADILLSQDLDAPTKELLTEIRKAGDRAASLTRQLLAFSRKQILEPKLLDLNVLVGDATRLLGRLIGEDVTLSVRLDSEALVVKADPSQLEQVIMNLAVNARDAMPRGGKLTIETHAVELDEVFRGTHGDVPPGPYALLAISDDGSGMTAEVMTHLFEPFFTTKDPGKGTGLGLATVYGIVRQSGGCVTVYSEPGFGSTFRIYLPRTEDQPAQRAPRAPIALPPGEETILLVEDDEAVRAMARTILRTCGYKVLEAANGIEALRVSDQHKGPIHLVVTDVVMPEMAGPALVERLAVSRPDARVLFVSGYTEDAMIGRSAEPLQPVAFLPKPYTPGILAQKVREVLGSGPAPEPAPEA
jgi:signal transduction histidine kinase/CheY-like chemotaxis protein